MKIEIVWIIEKVLLSKFRRPKTIDTVPDAAVFVFSPGANVLWLALADFDWMASCPLLGYPSSKAEGRRERKRESVYAE